MKLRKQLFFILIFSMPLFADRFEISGTTVKDNRTDLMWQREGSSRTFNYSSAIDYCKNLQQDGYDDWRLPHIDELKSIVNYGASNPATYSEFRLKSEWYWSSTISKSNSPPFMGRCFQ